MDAACYMNAMSDNDEPLGTEQEARYQGFGCAGTLAGINLLLMGLLASAFAVGPYSSAAQETWYRGGSITFLGLGAILPITVLVFISRRYRQFVTSVTVWLCAALLAFVCYVFMSGGGI
jgi:VIT1/CCC1 family predicted Fe2+/Mn2+ transporter